MTDHPNEWTNDGQDAVYGNYSPVNVTDTMGVIILGILAFILLIALLRSQGRNRKLLTQLADQER
jgi:hypothetical protein